MKILYILKVYGLNDEHRAVVPCTGPRYCTNIHSELQGVPKKMSLLSGFEFLTLGGVFLGVKNNSKNFGNKKI